MLRRGLRAKRITNVVARGNGRQASAGFSAKASAHSGSDPSGFGQTAYGARLEGVGADAHGRGAALALEQGAQACRALLGVPALDRLATGLWPSERARGKQRLN